MKNSIEFTTFMVECSNVAEMRELSNYSNTRQTIGGVEITISQVFHYYVVKSEADVERAKRWMEKHIQSVLRDFNGLDEYGHYHTYKSRYRHLVQDTLREAVGVEVLRPQRITSLHNTASTCICDIRA